MLTFLAAFSLQAQPPQQSITLNGTQYVDLGDPPSLLFLGFAPYTFEAWIRKAPGAGGTIVSRYGGGADPYHFSVSATGRLQHYRNVGPWLLETADGSIPDNVWTHVAVTYNGVNVSLYINGALAATSIWTSIPSVLGAHVLIGARWNGGTPNEHFTGVIDEVRIWNVARTMGDIAANRFQEIAPHPNLVGYWRLNGNANDASGNGINGTLSGAPGFVDGRFRYYYQSLDANNPANWNTALDGSGAAATALSLNGNELLIPNGRTATMTADIADFDAVNAVLRVQNGGQLNTDIFTLNGMANFDLQSGGTLRTRCENGFNGDAIGSGLTRVFDTSANYIFEPPVGADRNINLPTPQINNLTVIGPGFTRINSNVQVNGVFTGNGRVVMCGETFILGPGTHTLNAFEIWVGGGNFTVDGILNVAAGGIISIVGPAGCGQSGNVNGTGSINYAPGSSLVVGADWTGTLDTPELPIMPAVMAGNFDMSTVGAPITIANDLHLNGNLTLSAMAGRNMVMAMGRTLVLGAGIINAPASRIQVDNNNTLVLQRNGLNSIALHNQFAHRLVVDFPMNVTLTNNLTVGVGGLDFPNAGNLLLNGATTLRLEGAGANHVTGAGAGRVDATGMNAVVELTGNLQIDGAKFVAPIQTLRTGAMPIAAAILNAGTFSVNNLDVANGSLTTSVQVTANAGGAHAVAPGATLTIALPAGRLVVAGGATVNNNGAINVGGAGVLEIQGNGAIGGANFVNYTAPNAELLYSGAVAKLPTGLEFPNAMPGAVTVSNTAGVTQQAGTTKTVAGVFTLQGAGSYSLNGGTGNGLILNGTLVNSPMGLFQALDNNLTLNGTVTNPLRFGPTAAEWTLNNLTVNAAGGVVLGSNLRVNGTLTLTNGVVTSAPATLLSMGNAATVVGGSAASHIAGVLERDVLAAGAFLFPVGEGGAYMPFTLTNPGAVATVRITPDNSPFVAPGPHTTISSIFGNSGSWQMQVTAGAVGGGATTVTLRPTVAPTPTTGVAFTDGARTDPYFGIGSNVAPPNVSSVPGTTLTASAGTRFFAVGEAALPPTDLVFSNITNTSFDASFTAATPAPVGYLVVRRPAGAAATSPTNGVLPTVGSMLGAGTVLSNNASVGPFASVGMTPGTSYSIDVYSYNGSMATPTYILGQILTGTVTTTGGPGCVTAAPPVTVDVSLLERTIRYTGVAITGAGILLGTGTNQVYVNPGANLTLTYNYQGIGAPPTYCPGCVTQIYVGMNSAADVNVFRDCIASFPFNATGTRMRSFTAPMAPGVYYINVTGTWDFYCKSVNFATNFIPNNTIAMVIVGTPPCINNSDIVQPAFVYDTAIPYINHHNLPTGAVTNLMPNLWRIQLRDGGLASPDLDNYPTVLTQLTINVSNPAPLNRIALYNAAGTVKLDEQIAAGTIVFNISPALRPLHSTAPDDGTVDFLIKASYNTTVIDNAQFNFTITSAQVEPFAPATPRSGLLNTMAAIGPSGNSGVAVVADRPSWAGALGAVQPATVGVAPLQMLPDVRVAAVDINGNLDVDYAGTIQLLNPPYLVGGPLSVNAVGGLATFTGINAVRHNTAGTMQLTAQIGAQTAQSNAFTVQPAILALTPQTVTFGSIAVGQYVEQQFTLNAANLPSNGIVQFSAAHPHVSISTLGGGAFTTVATIPLVVAPAAPNHPLGSAVSQTFFARYAPQTNTPMNAQIAASFGTSTIAVVNLFGQGMATAVTTSTTTLDFGLVFTGNSADALYNVSAVSLSGPLTITASAGVTLSTTGSAPFTSNLTLYPSNSTLAPQLITARFTPTSFGATVFGTITHTNPYTTATVVQWQGIGGNPAPVALGFAGSMESASTATGGVPGAIQDGVPFNVEAAAFRADGLLGATSANLQLQIAPAPGGTAAFTVNNGAGNLVNANRITLSGVTIEWTNAPLAGGTTSAIISLVRTGGSFLQSTQAFVVISKGPTVPAISGVSPAIIGSGSTVTITGVNFFSSTTVTFGGVPAASFVVNSPTRITAVVASSGASGDVEVRAPGGVARTRTMGNANDTLRFFPPPTITDYNPKEGTASDVITFTGTNFDPSAFALFGGVPSLSATVNSPTQMSATVSGAGENGLVTVRAVGGSTTASVPFSFIRPPHIESVLRRFGTIGTEIIVTGSNFKAIQEVWLGPVMITLANVTIVSERELRFAVPAPVSGQIRVRNRAGVALSDDEFTFVPPPQVTSVTPDSGSLGSQITIRGQNFVQVTAVTVGGAPPIQTFVVSTSQIVVVLGAGSTSTAPIFIQTIGGSTASTIRFTFINPPSISTIRPLVGGPRTELTITGQNFSAIDRVTVGGLETRSFSVISTTQIIAVVSDAGASGNVQVFNRLGGAFSPEQFTFYFPPNVQNFMPFEGSTGSTITIIGEHFVNSTTTVVRIGGVRVAEFEVETPSRIVAVVSTGATGPVSVQTDGGTSATVMQFRFVPPREIPPPRIVNFSPDSATAGDIVTVEGLNFINVRSVRVGGVTIATFSVASPTSLSFVMEQVSSGTIEVQTTTGTAIARRALIYAPPRVQLTPLQRDSIAAVQIYNATDGANWTRKQHWLSPTVPIGQWQGVVVQNERITELNLDSAGLRGSLPVGASALTALKAFRASGNALEGAFPTSLLLLSNLEELSLSDNRLSGELPFGIASMSGLRVLRLNGNLFHGQIPDQLCALAGLRDINLSHNELSGPLPACLPNIPSLEHVDLSHNRFTGGIPTGYAALSALKTLLLQNNLLSGALPRALWSPTLAVSQANKAQKPTPNLANAGMRALVRLNLANNQFVGTIPPEISAATELQELILAGNQFAGTIPSSLSSLVQMRVFDVSRNELSGSIPASLRSWQFVERFAATRNRFSGVLPSEFGQLASLRVMELDSNDFSGAVPESFTALARLQTLRINRNHFNALPNLSGLSSLTTLQTEDNSLQFESLEPNIRLGGSPSYSFTYAPQDSVGSQRDTNAVVSLPFILSARMTSDNNRYQWFKNGREMPGETGRALTFPVFTRLDTGEYVARVTNTVVRGLTLITRPVVVRAITAPPPALPPLLLSPENNAQNIVLSALLEWLSSEGATLYDVQISSDASFASTVLDTTVSALSLRIPNGVLRSFTTYLWRVRSRNESGVSAWSPPRAFTTIDAGALVVIPTTTIGRSVIGRSRDGEVVVTSVSDIPIRIVGARIDGADASSFRIDTNATPVAGVTIPPFASYPLRVQFSPTSLGDKQARLTVLIQNESGGANAERSGIIRGTPTFVDVNDLDFDTVLVGFGKVRNLLIDNLGRDTVRINQNFIFSDTTVVRLDAAAQRAPYLIRPNETMSLPVVASSSREGEARGTIRIVTTQDTLTVNTRSFFRKQLPSDVRVRIGVTTNTAAAPPGAEVTVILYLAEGDVSELNRANNPPFSLSLRIDPQVLVLHPEETKILPTSSPGIYRLADARRENNLDRPLQLIELRFVAVAGSVNETAIEVIDPVWRANNIFVGAPVNGHFTSLISRAGGARRVAPAGSASPIQPKHAIIALSPNPSADEVTLTYSITEDEVSEIVLFDSRGAKMRTLSPLAARVKGEYALSFRTGDLPSGAYRVTIISPSGLSQERLNVVR
jgi:Leucine-rich repeat (LRR) protein